MKVGLQVVTRRKPELGHFQSFIENGITQNLTCSFSVRVDIHVNIIKKS